MKLDPHSPRRLVAPHNLTYYALVLVIAGVLSGCGLLDDYVAQSNKAESAENLKQLGLAIKIYVINSEGRFPPLSPERGQLVMDPNQIYPKYLSDPSVYISPAHPDAKKIASLDDPASIMRDHSYWYLGYAFRDEEGAMVFVEEYRRHVREGSSLPGYMRSDSNGFEFIRLNESVMRAFMPIGSHSKPPPAPVMIERPGLHEGGSNVLFTDGRVEFMEYPGEFPMTERFIHALESLDDLKE